MTWRDKMRPIIARVIAENDSKSTKEIREALREAWPFGAKEMHPYKVWLDEIRLQLGLRKDRQLHKGERITLKSLEGQQPLWKDL